MKRITVPDRGHVRRGGPRFIDEQDVREFKAVAKSYLEEVTNSRESALAKLIELGIIESDGKLAKNYR